MALNASKLTAIHYLSQPNKGGLNDEQIAQECGVSRTTLHKWKGDEEFNEELRARISKNIVERLPEVTEAMFKAATGDTPTRIPSAKAADLLFKAAGMYISKIEYTNKSSEVKELDRDEIKRRLEALKAQKNDDHEVSPH